MSDILELQEALQLGLSVVSELWSYKTKDWVTSIYAVDIDNDGEVEILVGSRDGRIHVLTQQGICRWERIVGRKKWIGAVTGIHPIENDNHPACIFVGTQDGKLYVYDKDGTAVSKDGKALVIEKNTLRSEREKDEHLFWHSSKYAIRNLHIKNQILPQIVIDSEDRDIYAVDYRTGEEHCIFQSPSSISAVSTCDVNRDEKIETVVVGTGDQHLYLLDNAGNITQPQPYDVPGQLHCIYAVQLARDGQMAILLGTDGKILSALDLQGKRLWRRPIIFTNRFRALCVADVDGDGQNEILVGSEDKHLYILDNQGNEIWRHLLEDRISSLYALDIDNDGQIEVLVGSQGNVVHVLRIRLVRGLDGKIRLLYQKVARSLLNVPEMLLPYQSSLLHDLIRETKSHKEVVTSKTVAALLEEEKQNPEHALALLHDLITEPRPAIRPATLEQVESLMGAKKHDQALTMALLLQQQKVQRGWQKGRIGPISAIGLGDISQDSKREIIVGTSIGVIYAFDAYGRELWCLPVGQAILALQTGYFDTTRWEKIFACSADYKLYIISGVKQESGTRHMRVSGNIVNVHRELNARLSSLYIHAPGGKKGPLHIIIGTEDKTVVVYKRTLSQPVLMLKPPHGVRIVSAHISKEEHVPAIVVGSAEDVDCVVYAYTQHGELLWEYQTKGRIEALCMRDIDGDEKIEVIIGAQDRNIHVVDQYGELKWRYLLPNFVLALDVYDIDGDGKPEILAGCDDGHLYVFSCEGDLLWKYQSYGSIQAVRVHDIDNGNNVEIVLGSENTLEVMRLVNQYQLNDLIEQCWFALLQQKPGSVLIQDFLKPQSSPYLRAFALQKLAEIQPHDPNNFALFETFIKDGSVEVRKKMLHSVITCYSSNPKRAQSILNHLITDQDYEFKYALVKEIGDFMRGNNRIYWDDGLKYLQRLAYNNSRSVRRATMRQICSLVEGFYGEPIRKGVILELLLTGLLEPTTSTILASHWVRQESARTFAHFIDNHPVDLLLYFHLLVARGVKPDILWHIASHVRTAIIKHVWRNLTTFISGLNESNMLSSLETVVNTLQEIRNLKYGEETFQIYKEFQYLCTTRTIEDIAKYHCSVPDIVGSTNIQFKIALSILQQMNLVARSLRQYLRRHTMKDRINSLLEAKIVIDKTYSFANQEYTTKQVLDELPAKLHDWAIMKFLLERWQSIITRELHQLEKSMHLVVELQTKQLRFEKQVVVCLLLRNIGHNTVKDVYIELLSNNEQFELIGHKSFETEEIFAQEEIIAEFTIHPLMPSVTLYFEIVYGDHMLSFEDQLEFQTEVILPQFIYISNPYSTGVPDADICYGREEDLKFLKRKLASTGASIILILHGQSRSGKTNLLFQLVRKPVLDPHIPVFIDMQEVSLNSNTFFYKIAHKIAVSFADRDLQTPLLAEEEFVHDPTYAFESFLSEVEKNLKNRKLVLIMDEFEVLEQQVQKKNLPVEIFDYLRSLIQHHPGVTFLFAGVHTLQELNPDYWSTFENIAEHHRLSKLSSEAVTRLIVEPVKGVIEYDVHAIRKIRQLTANQPFLIHVVCRILVDYCMGRKKSYVTINDINAILNEVMENSQSHFEWIWHQSKKQERYVLAMIAELVTDGGKQVSLIEIEEQYLRNDIIYRRESILKALNNLCEKDILEQTSGDKYEEANEEACYRIPVGLIRLWLRTKKPLRTVMRERESL